MLKHFATTLALLLEFNQEDVLLGLNWSTHIGTPSPKS